MPFSFIIFLLFWHLILQTPWSWKRYYCDCWHQLGFGEACARYDPQSDRLEAAHQVWRQVMARWYQWMTMVAQNLNSAKLPRISRRWFATVAALWFCRGSTARQPCAHSVSVNVPRVRPKQSVRMPTMEGQSRGGIAWDNAPRCRDSLPTTVTVGDSPNLTTISGLLSLWRLGTGDASLILCWNDPRKLLAAFCYPDADYIVAQKPTQVIRSRFDVQTLSHVICLCMAYDLSRNVFAQVQSLAVRIVGGLGWPLLECHGVRQGECRNGNWCVI